MTHQEELAKLQEANMREYKLTQWIREADMRYNEMLLRESTKEKAKRYARQQEQDSINDERTMVERENDALLEEWLEWGSQEIKVRERKD